jgi:1-deoxy-D-xylulose-5-phosphate synthase
MVPKDEDELQHMMKTAMECPRPVAFRYPRGKGEGVRRNPVLRSIEIGKAEVLREGGDMLILAIGTTVYPSIRAAERLEASGIHTTVVNARFLKPLDGDLIGEWARKIGKILTVEENVLQGGFGSAVLELLQEKGLSSVQVTRLGIPDVFVEHGSPSLLKAKYGIDEAGICRAVKEMVEKESSPSLRSREAPNTIKRVIRDSK